MSTTKFKIENLTKITGSGGEVIEVFHGIRKSPAEQREIMRKLFVALVVVPPNAKSSEAQQ